MHSRGKIMVDVSFFIAEVQKREALWNSKSPNYSDRYVKTLQWEELVEIFGGKNLSLDERRQTLITLRRKWKNLRDSFVRELKQHNSGIAFKRKPHYMWFNQLEFLKGLSTTKMIKELAVDTNMVDLNVLDTNTEDTDNESDDENDSSSKKTIRKESDITEELGSQLTYIQNKNLIETNTKEMDSDKLFLLSLLDDFKRIPEKLKTHAKCEILDIINKTLQRNVSRGFTQAYGQNYLTNYWRNYYSSIASMKVAKDPLDISTVPIRADIYTENNNKADISKIF